MGARCPGSTPKTVRDPGRGGRSSAAMPRAVAAAVPYAEADRPGPLRMENSNEKKKKARGVPAAGGKRLRRGAGRRKRGPGCLVKPPQCLAVSHRQTRPLCSDNGQGNVSDGRRGQRDLNTELLRASCARRSCGGRVRDAFPAMNRALFCPAAAQEGSAPINSLAIHRRSDLTVPAGHSGGRHM